MLTLTIAFVNSVSPNREAEGSAQANHESPRMSPVLWPLRLNAEPWARPTHPLSGKDGGGLWLWGSLGARVGGA